MIPEIIPVILCGGSGNRLWPISRQTLPKQYQKLTGQVSLFEQSLTRLCESSNSSIVITNNEHKFITQQLISVGEKDNVTILVEPEPKDTAPAILASAFYLHKTIPSSVMVVMPSDHLIDDNESFNKTIQFARNNLNEGEILCFGVKPDSPETNYGYIKVEQSKSTILNVSDFIEKPDLENAKKYLNDGDYLWNSGMFLCRPLDLINIAKNILPTLYENIKESVEDSLHENNFVYLKDTSWAKLTSISFDYAIMEKTKNTRCVLLDQKWSDLGNWESYSLEFKTDQFGNKIKGNIFDFGSKNSIFYSSEKQVITSLGLEDIAVIAQNDAVLVSKKSELNNLKHLLGIMKDEGVYQATSFEKEYRPWGWFKSIIKTPLYHVKIIYVNPGQKLSLQSHKHRAENWFIADGTASVVINNDKFTLEKNDSIFIQVCDKHQLANNTEKPLEIIEVQVGSYFGEDDIIRYEDIYNRI